jgi:LysM repeat protein
MCSYCYTKKYEMMQKSPYSAYDAQFKGDLLMINKKCGLGIPTDIPPPLVVEQVKDDSFCLSDIYHTTQDGDTCASIAKTYSVASAAVQYGNGQMINNCTSIKPGQKLCMPLTCDIYELQEDSLCITVEVEQGVRPGAILRTYNPWINSDCSNIQSGRQNLGGIVCISPQGGKSNNVSTIVKGNVVPSRAIGYTVDATPPPQGAKLAAGTIINCGKWHLVEKTETCAAICMQEQINIDLFVAVNPSFDRDDCNAKLVSNTTVCVGPRETWEDEL